MDNFLLTLSFALAPFATALIFSAIAPSLGATLSLRNEILLGIALPPVGAAIIAGAMLCGVAPESTLLLYTITAISLFLLMIILPLNSGKRRMSMRRRELILATLFCAGNTLTILFMALSPEVESHFKNLLQGEILAVSTPETIICGIVALLILLFAYFKRGLIYSYALDEETLKIKEPSYFRTTLYYRLAATLIITGGIILIGPLLTTALLIVPAFLMERCTTGLDRFMLLSTLTSFLGTIVGFLAAIVADLPPAPVVVCAIFLVGITIQIIPGRR